MKPTLNEMIMTEKGQGVICPVCKLFVERTAFYYDPYYSPTHAAQVHFKCLSDKRSQEISAAIRKENTNV